MQKHQENLNKELVRLAVTQDAPWQTEYNALIREADLLCEALDANNDNAKIKALKERVQTASSELLDRVRQEDANKLKSLHRRLTQLFQDLEMDPTLRYHVGGSIKSLQL